MRDDQSTEFMDYLRSVADMYGKALSDGVLMLYWNGLKDLDLQAIKGALGRHVQNPDSGQFMPKIADIRRMLGGTTNDAALQAWAKVDKAIRTVGTYQSVVFDDPVIHRAIADIGGWIWLGGQTDDEWPFIAKRFETAYRGHLTRGCNEYPPQLTGIAQANNERAGFAAPGPVLIGDTEKCQRVLAGGSNQPLLRIVRADEAVKRLA